MFFMRGPQRRARCTAVGVAVPKASARALHHHHGQPPTACSPHKEPACNQTVGSKGLQVVRAPVRHLHNLGLVVPHGHRKSQVINYCCTVKWQTDNLILEMGKLRLTCLLESLSHTGSSHEKLAQGIPLSCLDGLSRRTPS